MFTQHGCTITAADAQEICKIAMQYTDAKYIDSKPFTVEQVARVFKPHALKRVKQFFKPSQRPELTPELEAHANAIVARLKQIYQQAPRPTPVPVPTLTKPETIAALTQQIASLRKSMHHMQTQVAHNTQTMLAVKAIIKKDKKQIKILRAAIAHLQNPC